METMILPSLPLQEMESTVLRIGILLPMVTRAVSDNTQARVPPDMTQVYSVVADGVTVGLAKAKPTPLGGADPAGVDVQVYVSALGLALPVCLA
jgi:hypothetical protein